MTDDDGEPLDRDEVVKDDHATSTTKVGDGSGQPPDREETAKDHRAVQPPRTRINREAEDEALACRRRGQLSEAIEVLMKAYGSLILSFVLRIVRHRETAEDVCQQVFFEAFQGIVKFQYRSSFCTWLTSIAYHRSIDLVRRDRRIAATDGSDVLDALYWSSEQPMDPEAVGKRRALEQCLGKVHEGLRTVLLMRFHVGLSCVEIGEITGAPSKTVQMRIARVLHQLRRCLRGKGFGR